MKRHLPLATLSLALAAIYPATVCAAGANDALLKELQELKACMAELEKRLDSQPAAPAAPSGMTPEQLQDFNRIAVKTEAMEDSRDALGFKGLKISGYMDPTWIYNQRQHRAGFQFLNAVDNGGYFYDTSYIGTAVIDFTKETDSGARWRLTLSPQRGTQAVAEGSNSPVHEASVSVPLTDLQTRFIAGHLPDWSGYEYLQPTLNKLITHNLLFDTTLPAAYTGAGMELTRDKWIIKALVGNMNASKRQSGEKTPVVAYRVDYAKGEFQGFGFAGVHGKAPNASQNLLDGDGNPIAQRDSRVDLFEIDSYFIRGDLTAQAQFSVGRQRKASISPDPLTGERRDAHWTGLSALMAYKFEPWLEGIARLDHIWNRKNGGGLLTYTAADDRNGIGPAAGGDPNRGVDRSALTLGLGYNFNLNTVFKAEYRIDRASGAVFRDTRDGGFKKTNQLLATSVVVSF